MTTATEPWAMSLATDRHPSTQAGYAAVAIDPATQLAVFTDEAGNVVEWGKHGTSYDYVSTPYSGGGDGSGPQPQVADDSPVDVGSDEASG